MQQKNINGSILIWSFFLTILMSLSFIMIQFKIKYSLTSNSTKLENLESEKEKQDLLGNIILESQQFGENTLKIKNFSNINYSLKKDEILELNFSDTGNIILELKSGIISYTTGVDFGNFVLPTYNTGATSTGFSVNNGDTLKIKNFSGYSTIKILSGDYNLSAILKNNTYKIYKETWGKEIIIEKGLIN